MSPSLTLPTPQARILAIFDDLDTLLLMVPLKAIVVGARCELSIDPTVTASALPLPLLLPLPLPLPMPMPMPMPPTQPGGS